jgi:hypothetical protein
MREQAAKSGSVECIDEPHNTVIRSGAVQAQRAAVLGEYSRKISAVPCTTVYWQCLSWVKIGSAVAQIGHKYVSNRLEAEAGLKRLQAENDQPH